MSLNMNKSSKTLVLYECQCFICAVCDFRGHCWAVISPQCHWTHHQALSRLYGEIKQHKYRTVFVHNSHSKVIFFCPVHPTSLTWLNSSVRSDKTILMAADSSGVFVRPLTKAFGWVPRRAQSAERVWAGQGNDWSPRWAKHSEKCSLVRLQIRSGEEGWC